MPNAVVGLFQAILVRLSFTNQAAIAVGKEKLLQAELSKNTEADNTYIISRR
jgi:hypothetical protein